LKKLTIIVNDINYTASLIWGLCGEHLTIASSICILIYSFIYLIVLTSPGQDGVEMMKAIMPRLADPGFAAGLVLFAAATLAMASAVRAEALDGSPAAVQLAALPGAAATVPDPAAAPPIDKNSGRVLMVSRADLLGDVFGSLGYSLPDIRDAGAAVPRLWLKSLPQDLHELDSAADRKLLFFRAMLPLVLRVNEEIMADRRWLLALGARLARGRPMSAAETARLAGLTTAYEADEGDIETLITRVDVIPVSLALAQAAVESGWGTSRFARQGNAVFGQIRVDGHGIASQDEDFDPDIRFAAFDTLLEGVRSYARNLNTHPAYRGFRSMRAERRAEGHGLDGHALAGTLLAYSELGGEYVAFVRLIMRQNDLAALDRARLEEATPVPAAAPLI
jgi:Bax protein